MDNLAQNIAYTERHKRLKNQFLQALGEQAEELLFDSNTLEIMLNEDGSLWFESLSAGMQLSKVKITDESALNLINVLASLNDTFVNARQPSLQCELPFAKARLQAWIPPVVSNPSFVIRKHLLHDTSIEELLKREMLTPSQLELILDAYKTRKNILIAGGTGSGKTTLIAGILKQVASQNSTERFIVIQDTPELYCRAPNALHLNTCDCMDLDSLGKTVLRARPDRIIVGELRGREAHGLIKLWNTGHPGGLSTIHANNSESALSRIEHLVQEAGIIPQGEIIAQTIDLVIFIDKSSGKRCVSEILRVEGYDSKNKTYLTNSLNKNQRR